MIQKIINKFLAILETDFKQEDLYDVEYGLTFFIENSVKYINCPK
jgi:hypothetical protein